MIVNNKATCRRTFILKIFGGFERNSNILGCKGVIQTYSGLKHTQNMYKLFISKHQVPQLYDYEKTTFVVIEFFG